MVNIDFEFDFEEEIKRAYNTNQMYDGIKFVSEALKLEQLDIEDAIRKLININTEVLAEVLNKYNRELLEELSEL